MSSTAAAARNDALATLALVTLTLAGVYSMTRLFTGHSFAGPVVTVVLATHAVAWACRKKGLPPAVACLVCLGVVALVVAWTVLPSSTAYGIPFLGTLHAARASLHQATADFHRVTAPAPPTQGFVMLAATGAGVLAMLADWAAFRMRATMEATVPSFALFVFCAAIGGHAGRTGAVAVEVAALVLFVVVHQVVTDQETTAWFANRTAGALGSALTTGSVIGLAALIVALNLGLRLPGATRRALIAWRNADGGGGTRNTVSPLVDLQSRLLDPSSTPVFTVSSSQPEYWRETALDSFDGTSWNALSTYHSAGSTLSGGSTPTVGGTTVTQSFSITNLDSPWLPAAYRPIALSGIKGVTWDSQSGSLITDKSALSGAAYKVTSVVSQGSDEAARLRAAPAPDLGAQSQYLQLPQLSDQVRRLAQSIVAGKTTEYDKALALQNYFRDNFTYNLRYEYQGPNPLDHFLLSAKQGFCQQFAGAYAALARAMGIPARLGVGWSWGEQTSPGVYLVTDEQAHTWPEVYFTGVGWVPFEPTPGRGIPGAQDYTGVAPLEAGAAAPAPAATATTVTTQPASAATTPSTPDTKPSRTNTGSSAHHGGGIPWLRILEWLGAAVAALALFVGVALGLRWLHAVAARDRMIDQADGLESEDEAARVGMARRRQDRFARFREQWAAPSSSAVGTVLRRAKAILLLGWLLPILPGRHRPDAPRPEVVARAELLLSWSEAVDLLAWWGVVRRPSETYRELAHRAGIELRGPLNTARDSVHALLQLADAGTKAEFGLASISDAEVAAAAANLAIVKAALLGSASGTQRLRLAIDPRLSVKVR